MEELILEITKGVQGRLKAGVAWATAIEWAMLETLSAVPDGLPLPDEVGRYWVTGGVQPIGGGQVMLPWLDNMAARGATVVIALTGTGKEEE